MNEQITSASEAFDPWTWIILAGLLVLAVVVSFGGLALTSIPPQAQTAATPVQAPAPQTAPAPR